MCFCYGTYATVLRLCMKDMDGVLLTLNNAILKSINCENYSDDYNKVWKLFNCATVLSQYVIEAVSGIDPGAASDGFAAHVLPLLDQNNYKVAILAIRDIILNDNVIDGETVVYTDSSTKQTITKSKLSELNTFIPADFFAGALIFAVSRGDNKRGKNYVKELNRLYIESFRNRQSSIKLADRNDNDCCLLGTCLYSLFDEPPLSGGGCIMETDLTDNGQPISPPSTDEKRSANIVTAKEAMAISFILTILGQVLCVYVFPNQMGIYWNMTSLVISLTGWYIINKGLPNVFRASVIRKGTAICLASLAILPVIINRLTVHTDNILFGHLFPNALGLTACFIFYLLFRKYSKPFNHYEHQNYLFIIAATLSLQCALLIVVLFNQHAFAYQYFNNLYLLSVISWCIFHTASLIAYVSYSIRVNKRYELDRKEALCYLLLIPFFIVCGFQHENLFVFNIFLMATPMIVAAIGLIWLLGYKVPFHDKYIILIFLSAVMTGYIYWLWRYNIINQYIVPLLACVIVILLVFHSQVNKTALDLNEVYESLYWLMLNNNRIIDKQNLQYILDANNVPKNDDGYYYLSELWETLKNYNQKPCDFQSVLNKNNIRTFYDIGECGKAARIEAKIKLKMAQDMLDLGEPVDRIQLISTLSDEIITSMLDKTSAAFQPVCDAVLKTPQP